MCPTANIVSPCWKRSVLLKQQTRVAHTLCLITNTDVCMQFDGNRLTEGVDSIDAKSPNARQWISKYCMATGISWSRQLGKGFGDHSKCRDRAPIVGPARLSRQEIELDTCQAEYYKFGGSPSNSDTDHTGDTAICFGRCKWFRLQI